MPTLLIIGSLVSVIFQTKSINISYDDLFVFFVMSFMTVNEESLGLVMLTVKRKYKWQT